MAISVMYSRTLHIVAAIRSPAVFQYLGQQVLQARKHYAVS